MTSYRVVLAGDLNVVLNPDIDGIAEMLCTKNPDVKPFFDII